MGKDDLYKYFMGEEMNKYKTFSFGIILCLFLFFKSSLAENLEIVASGFLEWNQENNSYIADGNAIASQGTRSIKADKITAFYESEENRDIVRIEAEGAVKFADTGNSGYSETLTYEMDAKLFILSGNKNQFRSEKFTAEASNRIQYDELNGELFLQDDAQISISGERTIKAQQIEILLSDNGDLKSVKAFEKVKLIEEMGRIAHANQAFYQAESGTMTLKESVEIIDGKNLLQGDTAIINVKTGYSKILAGSKNQRVSGKLILSSSN